MISYILGNDQLDLTFVLDNNIDGDKKYYISTADGWFLFLPPREPRVGQHSASLSFAPEPPVSFPSLLAPLKNQYRSGRLAAGVSFVVLGLLTWLSIINSAARPALLLWPGPTWPGHNHDLARLWL